MCVFLFHSKQVQPGRTWKECNASDTGSNSGPVIRDSKQEAKTAACSKRKKNERRMLTTSKTQIGRTEHDGNKYRRLKVITPAPLKHVNHYALKCFTASVCLAADARGALESTRHGPSFYGLRAEDARATRWRSGRRRRLIKHAERLAVCTRESPQQFLGVLGGEFLQLLSGIPFRLCRNPFCYRDCCVLVPGILTVVAPERRAADGCRCDGQARPLHLGGKVCELKALEFGLLLGWWLGRGFSALGGGQVGPRARGSTMPSGALDVPVDLGHTIPCVDQSERAPDARGWRVIGGRGQC